MDLIYTNPEREDQGVLQDYELDLAFGSDENDLECKIQASAHCCEPGSLLYFEGTEYGGIVDSIESETDSAEITYTGRTWHGILNSKVLEPDSGADYLIVSGEANEVLAALVERLDLSPLFSASETDSGITISNYKMNRYISGYNGIAKMLKSVGAKLKLFFDGSTVVLSAEPIHDYTKDEEFDADLVPFKAKRNYRTVNHLICLGAGELANRLVVHLYANENGEISKTQTKTGLDEVSEVFEYSNISDAEELETEGKSKFAELLSADEISLDFDADSDVYDVGDLIGAYDNITGLYATSSITKKIVKIKNGTVTVSLSPDKAKSVSSSSGVGGGESETFTVDDELSSTSENPVQNKIITEALENHNHGGKSISPVSIELTPPSAESNGGFIDFHFGGGSSDYTSRIVEDSKGEIRVDALLKLSKTLGISYGGTGVSSLPALSQNVFGKQYDDAQSVGTYPAEPGIYRTVGSDIFSNLSFTHGNYGVLVIFKAGYGLHIYADENGRMFYGRSGDTFGEPTAWKRVDPIVEEGTSGVWTYRKYESGWAECWGSQNYSGTTNESWGGLYALVCTSPNYPISFSDYPYVQRSILNDSGNACMLAGWTAASKTNPGNLGLVRPNSANVSATVKFYAVGHWK